MKKLTVLILFLFCITVLFSGCAKETEYNTTEVQNVSIRIEDVSSTGATVIIKDTNQKPFGYGEWYSIERKSNGKWFEVEPIIEEYGFEDIEYLLDENGENREMEFNIDWEWIYGELPSGSYRLLKQVDNRYISVEFDIK